MNHRMRRIVETLACERRYGIADSKGAEYSGAGSTYKETGADTLRNFKAVSERVGITPEQALLVYMLKHMDSITTAVREASAKAEPVEPSSQDIYAKGEGIVSRLDDLRNYADLLECLLIDNGHISDVDLTIQADVTPNPWSYLDEECEALNADLAARPRLDNLLNEKDLKEAGLVECLDGVWRPGADKDASVKNPGEVQTPIFAQPTMDAVRYGETGELS